MKNCKTIKTKRLLLKPFSKIYLSEKYISWLNNTDLMKFSENRHREHTFESCREYLESFHNSPHFFWAVTMRKTGEHIGNINAYLDINNSVADIGIIIGEKSAFGKGYGSEAWNAVCNYLLNNKDIRKITAGTMASNRAMLRIMEKSGMIPDGIRKDHYLLNGKPIDIIHMAKYSK